MPGVTIDSLIDHDSPHHSAKIPQYPESENDLCTNCHRLDLKNAFYRKISRRRIGTFIDITRSKHCPFCRLIIASLQCTSEALPDNEDELLITNALSWELGIERSPYDSTKTDSYSNKFDLRSKSAKCDYQAYRIVIEVERRPDIYGILQRICRDANSPERYFFGRPIDPHTVGLELLKHWTGRCEHWHGDSCEDDGVASRGLPSSLRLIDVERRRIVTVTTSWYSRVAYLTLSYVWGVAAMRSETRKIPRTLTRSMIIEDDDGQEDTPLPTELPRTIEDAIYLTKMLGYKYIWVDALCIVQDDLPEEKNKSLKRMDAIYNCSALTIVAASGRHADVGIPGIGPRRTHAPYVGFIDRMSISTMSPSYTDLENSHSLTWNTRGWTFQEKILAKRLLLFTDYQVYFKCAESIWIEEAYMKTDELSKSIESRPEKYRWGPDRPQSKKFVPTDKTVLLRLVFPQLNIDDPWVYLGRFSDYASALREYTCRSLSNPEDKLKAIHGVFRTLRSDTGAFFYGHPENYFLQSLLWHPVAGSHIVRSNTELPSWSWAGWETDKGIVYDVLDVRVLSSIMLALRDMLKRVVKFMTAILGKFGSGSSPSTSSTTTPYFHCAAMRWYRSREWSVRKIASQTMGNLAVVFALPLLDRRHTVSELYFCDAGEVSGIQCDESLRLNTFLEDEIGAGKGRPTPQAPKMTYQRRGQLAQMSLRSRHPFISLRTVIVHFRIGRCLRKPAPVHEDEVSVFELLDMEYRCVGEIWTTLEVAQRRPKEGSKFATISWGLSLTFAKITRQYIPRWTLDAAKLPESQLFTKWRPAIDRMFRPPPRKTLARKYEGGPGDDTRTKSELTVMSFFDSLFNARAKEPLPKSLWSTVNLLLVEMEGQSAQRLGVGRVIFGAWLMDAKFNMPEEVILE